MFCKKINGVSNVDLGPANHDPQSNLLVLFTGMRLTACTGTRNRFSVRFFDE